MPISSVFFAVLHLEDGPKIMYQVPEGLITTPPRSSISRTSSDPSTGEPSPPIDTNNTPTSTVSPTCPPICHSTSKAQASSMTGQSQSLSTTNTAGGGPAPLFEFELISQFAIPQAELCGRLMICTTRKHRIVGFPVILKGAHYDREMFQYNLCFVFQRDLDVSPYEPVVRKVARVLTVCEKERGFLSDPATSKELYPILEQLFADLNSFSETSIRLDSFNSLELKIFPHYPDPPPVHVWDVPVPLINIKARVAPNWDLTMAKVVPLIDGTNHVKKIAVKANADIELVKECMSHLLMYQCIMMVDIFQFSNVYALCRPISWLLADPAIYEECGPYVYRESAGGSIPPWPRLAWLYARIKPPLTVGQWMDAYAVPEGIDVRRFVSFGVIKGFLRRVHRWPVLLEGDQSAEQSSLTRRKGKTVAAPVKKPFGGTEEELQALVKTLPLPAAPYTPVVVPLAADDIPRYTRRRPSDYSGVPLHHSSVAPLNLNLESSSSDSDHRQALSDPTKVSRGMQVLTRGERMKVPTLLESGSLPTASQMGKVTQLGGLDVMEQDAKIEVPAELSCMLDGTHHADELCVWYEWSWSRLEQVLRSIGGAQSVGDLGRVVIIYR